MGEVSVLVPSTLEGALPGGLAFPGKEHATFPDEDIF